MSPVAYVEVKMNIVVIMPTFNEAENIGKMIDVLVGEVFPKIKNHKMMLLVVDDNSPDGTGDIVKGKMSEYKEVALLSGAKEGLGRAFARGMRYAMNEMKAGAVVEMDADFQHDPKDVERMVAQFDKGYDYVIGSRYVKGGGIPAEWEFYRKFISWGGSFFARSVLLLFKVHDVTSGFKLTRVEGFLGKLDLDNLISLSYAYKIQLLYEIIKDGGAKVVEVPIKFHHRERGSSKIESEDLRESLKVVLVLFSRSRFFRFAVVGGIGFLVNSLSLEFFRMSNIFGGLASTFFYLRETKFFLLSAATAWSAAAAAEVAIISNFTFHNLWTFAQERITDPKRMIWKFSHFNITSVGGIIIQFAVIGTAVTIFGDTLKIRQVALFLGVLFLVVPYNYTMYNVVVWKRWRVSWLPFLYRKNLSS